ncbi:hypothetical protein ISU10_11260 [Nocardioides agariphilus]|jgi:hypothetical protein|uniref:Lipoprotein n=1 Tax=Nocardioides agariphilus TaxID=433664 RepID=A0A930YQ32_9ACTN|nr:hypothetical protein [Nocardioides agariphilus]MBF4768345.1 hypothetical protein [Nocardioides agariphilus]
MRAGWLRARSTIWSPALVVAALVGLAGCGGDDTFCNQIGAVSGVGFVFSEVVAAHPGEVLRVEACVEDTCETRRATEQRPHNGMRVAPDLLQDTSPVPVTLTVSTTDGDIVYQGRLTVQPVKSQPNGPDCPPTEWVADVVASGTDVLQQERV